MLKVIFLDIDGVLNYKYNTPKKWNSQICFELNKILLLYNIKIIITSTWRHHYTLLELSEIFINNGITAEIIGATGAIHSGDRGEEILDYINNKFISEYAIIDDNVTDIKPYFNKNIIEVKNSNIGLTTNNLIDIEIIFKK